MSRTNFGFKPASGKTSIKRASGAGETDVFPGNKNGAHTKFTRAVVTNKGTWKGKLKKGQRLA